MVRVVEVTMNLKATTMGILTAAIRKHKAQTNFTEERKDGVEKAESRRVWREMENSNLKRVKVKKRRFDRSLLRAARSLMRR